MNPQAPRAKREVQHQIASRNAAHKPHALLFRSFGAFCRFLGRFWPSRARSVRFLAFCLGPGLAQFWCFCGPLGAAVLGLPAAHFWAVLPCPGPLGRNACKVSRLSFGCFWVPLVWCGRCVWGRFWPGFGEEKLQKPASAKKVPPCKSTRELLMPAKPRKGGHARGCVEISSSFWALCRPNRYSLECI